MNKVRNVLVIAAISGLVSFLVVTFWGRPETIIIKEESAGQISRLASFSQMVADTGTDFTLAAEKTVNSVVHVKTEMMGKSVQDPFYSFFYGQPLPPQVIRSSGSGVIISPDGYIVTNNHVVQRAENIEVVLNSGKSYGAEVIGSDPTTDLALLKIKADELNFIYYGNSDATRVGEWVLAVGNPFNLTSTVTAGIVSAKGRNINILGADITTGSKAIESFIQTDAAVNPGNSGGALVNIRGELIGINSAIQSATGSYIGYSFAIPVNIVKKVVEDLKEFGTVQRAFIGVNIRDIDNSLAKEKELKDLKGVYVISTSDNGAAQDAGIREGDVIIKVGNVSVTKVPELQEQISQFRPGDEVVITLRREGNLIEKKMTLKNYKGNTALIRKETKEILDVLGAQLEDLAREEMEVLRINGGAKVARLWNGKLMSAKVREGFIILRIDGQEVRNSTDVTRILEGKRGGLLFEGIYPNGKAQYYAIGM